jgi:hypothetical protein
MKTALLDPNVLLALSWPMIEAGLAEIIKT